MWVKTRYIKGKAIENIGPKPFIDSAQWKEILDSKALISKCLVLSLPL